jgi:hypothetical protein
MRCLSLTLVAALLVTQTGCAAGARLMLFAGAPAFVLEAEPDGRATVLVVSGLDPDARQDDLCGPDDGEECHDEVFLGIAFYRSDDGPYGEYVELGRVEDGSEWRDEVRAGPDTAWRAATVRQELDPEGEIVDTWTDEASTAAVLPADDGR